MEKKKRKFLKLPHLDGGKELLKKFIRENLRYPKEALENNIEGDVIIKFKVTGKGEVISPEIVKSIGYGCDEEAIRLVLMLSYQAVKNRGVRVITDNSIKIPFRIRRKKTAQKYSISYTGSTKEQSAETDKTKKQTWKKQSGQQEVYTYTVSY